MNVAAQQNKDQAARESFKGVWILNPKKSDTPVLGKNSVWTIEIIGNKVVIEKIYTLKDKSITNNVVLWTDGRGETNKAIVAENGESQTLVSKTIWQKERLVRQYVNSNSPDRLVVAETYFLSKDGSRLTVEARFMSGASGFVSVPALVFDRKP